MAYRNVNKIICGKFNVNLCPRLIPSNSDIVCACLRRCFHQNSRIPDGQYMMGSTELRHSKSCLFHKKRMQQRNPLPDLNFSTLRSVEKLEEHSPRYSLPMERSIVQNLTNQLKATVFGPSRHQSEGNIKTKNKTVEKDHLRSQYKSETNTLGYQRNENYPETLKLKYNATYFNLPEFKTTRKGFKHQFLIPQKTTLAIDFQDELLTVDDYTKKNLGKIKPKPRKTNQHEKLIMDIENKTPAIKPAKVSINQSSFSRLVRDKMTASAKSPLKFNNNNNNNNNNKQQKKVVQPVEHIKFEENRILKENSKNIINTGNRASKYTFQHLAFKSSKEPSTFRKIPSRHFYSKSRLNATSFRLKRDVISPDINEMYIRHHFKKSSTPPKRSDPLDLHNFNYVPPQNLKNERASKLSSVY